MTLIIIILLLFILFGGGYWGHSNGYFANGGVNGTGFLPLLLIVVLLLIAFGGFGLFYGHY